MLSFINAFYKICQYYRGKKVTVSATALYQLADFEKVSNLVNIEEHKHHHNTRLISRDTSLTGQRV